MAQSSAVAAPVDDRSKKFVKLADTLLSKVPGLPGVLDGKRRVRQFRGKKLIEFILSDAARKVRGLEQVDNEDKAVELCHALLNNNPQLFASCEAVVNKATGHREKIGGVHILRALPRKNGGGAQMFDREGRYYWVYQGNESWNTVKLGLIALAVVAMCCYQVWPLSLRVIVWYIAVTLLLVLLGVTAVQLIVFGTSWLLGYELWLVPNLWADDASVFELFTPLYTFEKGAEGRAWYRIGVAAVLVALGAWVFTQPMTDFDTFLTAQKQFVTDLYEGTLLGDGTEGGSGLARSTGPASAGLFSARYGAAAYGGGRTVKVPKFEELDKILEEETAAAAEGAEGEGGLSAEEAAAAQDAGIDAMLEAEEVAEENEERAAEQA